MLYELTFSLLSENVSMPGVEPKTYKDNADIKPTQFIQTNILFGNIIWPFIWNSATQYTTDNGIILNAGFLDTLFIIFN